MFSFQSKLRLCHTLTTTRLLTLLHPKSRGGTVNRGIITEMSTTQICQVTSPSRTSLKRMVKPSLRLHTNLSKMWGLAKAWRNRVMISVAYSAILCLVRWLPRGHRLPSTSGNRPKKGKWRRTYRSSSINSNSGKMRKMKKRRTPKKNHNKLWSSILSQKAEQVCAREF